MEIGFSVRVTDPQGNGVEGAEVVVYYPYSIDKHLTDRDGWAVFEKSHAFGDAVQTTIFVNGEVRAEGVWIESGNSFSFTSRL